MASRSRFFLIAAAAAAVAGPALAQSPGVALAAARQRSEGQARQQRLLLLQALYHKTVDIDFQGTPARDAFAFLRTALGVNMVVHEDDTMQGMGIDGATPITLSLEGATAVEVLDLVLEQCSIIEPCTWQLRKSYIEVGTKERLSTAAAREVRAFAVDEILFEAPDFEDAPPMGFAGATSPAPLYLPDGGYSGSFGGVNARGARGNHYLMPQNGAGVGIGTPRSTSSPDLARKAQELIDMIVETVEPDAWTQNGGDRATISYQDGALIISAPDYIQRQLFGYGKVPPPAAPSVP